MQHLGDPAFATRSGAKQKLVLFDQQGPRYTVHGDLFDGKVSAESATTGTAVLHIQLKASGQVLRIPEMLFAELWVEPPGSPPARICLGRFRIDYWQATHDASTSGIAIHGRGPLGLVIDEPRHVVFAGELEQLVAALCTISAPTDIEGLESHPINVYVNMDSTYAALRLLGVSLGFVVKEDHKLFRIKIAGERHERQRVMSKPMFEINDSNTLASTYTKGSPLKKRT